MGGNDHSSVEVDSLVALLLLALAWLGEPGGEEVLAELAVAPAVLEYCAHDEPMVGGDDKKLSASWMSCSRDMRDGII